MQIQILDRLSLELMSREQPFKQNTMLISISDVKKGGILKYINFNHIPDYCLFLYFDDLCVSKSRSAISETDVSHISRHFSWCQARMIASFVKENLDKVDDIICQCEYGVSRSAAVAAAILEYTEGRGKDIFNDMKYHPNPGVYTMTLAAFEDDDIMKMI